MGRHNDVGSESIHLRADLFPQGTTETQQGDCCSDADAYPGHKEECLTLPAPQVRKSDCADPHSQLSSCWLEIGLPGLKISGRDDKVAIGDRASQRHRIAPAGHFIDFC
jgi:hypothetical protein